MKKMCPRRLNRPCEPNELDSSICQYCCGKLEKNKNNGADESAKAAESWGGKDD